MGGGGGKSKDMPGTNLFGDPGGQGAATSPPPYPVAPIVPQVKQLPGYSNGYGISLFGQLSPDELAAYNEQEGIATGKRTSAPEPVTPAAPPPRRPRPKYDR